MIRNNQLDDVVKAVLRTYGAVFEQVTNINYSIVATKASKTIEQVHQVLLTLEKDDIIDYEHQNYDTAITFLVPRDDDRTINVIAPYIKAQATYKKSQVDSIKTYLATDTVCRAIQLMQYFDETLTTPCGKCDVCTNATQQVSRTAIHSAIMDILREGPKTSREISQLDYPQQSIINTIRLLLDQKKIAILANNTYTLL